MNCPFHEYVYGYYCKASGKKLPSDVGENLCKSNNHEDCPVYKYVKVN
ncbi:MAG: hypothetical protein FWE23_04145 [Chitinivibrionia bacterium]|nr:hypothetical protein [Chitinivibrionia bacterium]